MHLTTKDRVLQFIDYKGISKTVFLNETDIKRGFLDKDKLKASVSDILLEKIIQTYPEIDLIWLITGKGNMLKKGLVHGKETIDSFESQSYNEFPPVPVYTLDAITNSSHPVYSGPKEAESALLIPHMPNCDAALYIHTDTMYPILRTGDIVCYKRVADVDNIYWGEMYVMDISRQEDENYLTLKYIHKSDIGDDYISLRSHNPIYPPQDILKSNINRMGLVKVCIRYNCLV